jgi:GT2 family glycosyltransferase
MNQASTTKLSVIVVNYDTWPDVLDQADTLAHSPEILQGKAELIVVDNASPTRPVRRPESSFGVTWIERPDNGGFAAGVNTGWRKSRGDWLLLLNPDVVASEELLSHVLALLDEIDRKHDASRTFRIGIVGVTLTNPDGSRQPSVGAFPSVGRGFVELFLPRSRRRYQIVSPQKFGQVDWVTGAFFLVRSEVMTELAGFDEDYFLYFEEMDFCCRASRAGWATCFDPSIQVCHQKPLQNRSVSPKIRLLTRHSRLLYFRKNTSRLQFRVMMELVRFEAMFRIIAARFGSRQDVSVWRAVRDLVPAFRKNQEPLGTEVAEWADKSLGRV